MKQSPEGNISNWYSSDTILCVTSMSKENMNKIKKRMGILHREDQVGLILFLSGKKEIY